MMGSMRTFVTDRRDRQTDGGYFKGPNGVGPKIQKKNQGWAKLK